VSDSPLPVYCERSLAALSQSTVKGALQPSPPLLPLLFSSPENDQDGPSASGLQAIKLLFSTTPTLQYYRIARTTKTPQKPTATVHVLFPANTLTLPPRQFFRTQYLQSIMSEPESPTSSNQSEGHYSEVATEPLPESERQLVYEYMSRRQHFLSDYERDNPVQNMQMLANHVFDLSENIYRLKSDFTSSRRLLDIVSANQRDGNESIMYVGNDLGRVGQEVHVFKEDMHNMKDDMHNMKDDVGGFRSQVTDDLGGLRQDINTLRSELHAVRSETQQGLLELKQMLSMLVSVRV